MGILFGCLGIALFIAGILLGSPIHIFIDPASVLIVIGGTTFFTLAYHSVGATVNAFKAAFGQGPVEAEVGETHLRVLTTARVLASASGVLGTLIGMVAMLQNMSDPKAIGPAMAVALLTLFYGVILAELLLGPLMNRLKNRISDHEPKEPPLKTAVVTVAAIPVSLLAFFVMLLSISGFYG